MKNRTIVTSLFVLTLIFAVSLTGCPTEVDQLSEQLKNPNSLKRWETAEKLGQTKDPKAVAPLIKAMGDEAPEVHWAAAGALGEIGAPAVNALLPKLKDKNVRVRECAVLALGLIGDKKTVKAIIPVLLRDKSVAVQTEAATALGNICQPEAISALTTAAKSQNAKLKTAATEAIKKINAKVAELKKKAKDAAEAKAKAIADAKAKRKAAEAAKIKKAAEAKKRADARAAKKKADAATKKKADAAAKKKAAADYKKRSEEARKRVGKKNK